MQDLFKNFWDRASCQKNGVCSTNPVLNAIDTVIINEIRQIAFYAVKLKEFGFTNREMMKGAVFALSVNLTETNFDKKALLGFFKNLQNTKNKIKDFYIKKCAELNISYEIVTSPFLKNEKKEINTTDLIKEGETIIHQFYNAVREEKARLINLIILLCKMTSVVLMKLSVYKNCPDEYYFEILRLLSLTNQIGTREEKFVRRIKEFSEISYDIQTEFDRELTKAFGERKTAKVGTKIYEGKAILISGGDLDELFLLLEAVKDKDINVYLNPTMLLAVSYPKFTEYKNLKGVFGTNDIEYDFSTFKGPVYITRNSSRSLDSAYRGLLFTSKVVPCDKTFKIKNENLSPLIEEAEKLEGFYEEKEGREAVFEFDLNSIQKHLEEGKKILIAIGPLNEEAINKFKNYEIINFVFPFETEGLHYVIDRCKKENTSVWFSDCAPSTINTASSLFNKNLSEIYITQCEALNINPHVTEALELNFGVKIL